MMAPITDIASPIMDLVYGPSRSGVNSVPQLKIYPMFGPLTTCFFSRTHAPFTIVMNEFDRDRYGVTGNINRPDLFALPSGGLTGTYNPYLTGSSGKKRKKRQLQTGRNDYTRLK